MVAKPYSLVIIKEQHGQIVHRKSDGRETVLINIPETATHGGRINYVEEELPTRGRQKEFTRKYKRRRQKEEVNSYCNNHVDVTVVAF